VERLWRTVKYEDIYPRDYTTPRELERGLAGIGIHNAVSLSRSAALSER
jgi:hypothetical protein